MSSSADVDKSNSKCNETKGVTAQTIDKTDNCDSDIKFSCFICGIQEICHYFGRKPPFVIKQIEFVEDTYVMRDPFTPRETGRAHFLQIGGHCGKCERSVCVDCSTFYSKRYCNECCAEYLSEFPPEIGLKIQKQLNKE